ncbi:epidermal growth factor receptor-like, partial [Mobula birostris]|uniref:epidermal growth factor receptor-like n=1 Tax=Mobula birostris TaxID=1983395 RepID=UPI003B27FDCE
MPWHHPHPSLLDPTRRPHGSGITAAHPPAPNRLTIPPLPHLLQGPIPYKVGSGQGSLFRQAGCNRYRKCLSCWSIACLLPGTDPLRASSPTAVRGAPAGPPDPKVPPRPSTGAMVADSVVPRATGAPLLVLLLCGAIRPAWLSFPRVCPGTDVKMTQTFTLENHYYTLRKVYENCREVQGNLEITHLKGHLDLTFLKDIQEVQGYVLIAHNEVSYIPLENLRVIRGSQLYEGRFALAVLSNYNPSGTGLRELRMRRLTEILTGSVWISDNPLMCFQETIQWDDIQDKNNKFPFAGTVDWNRTVSCESCSPLCESSSCWGSGPDYCQTLTRKICAQECLTRCKGTHPTDCCHSECAAGCVGPKDTDCLHPEDCLSAYILRVLRLSAPRGLCVSLHPE